MVKTKIIRLVGGALIALSLLLASCATPAATTDPGGLRTSVTPTTSVPPTTTKPSGNPTVTVSLKKVDGTSMTRTVEKPQYGGSIKVAIAADYTAWDPYNTRAVSVGHMQFTSTKLIQGNWAIGPAGTQEVDWSVGYAARLDLMTGGLAASWELPDDTTIIYRLKQGIHYFLNPNAGQANTLVNGRELVADDVATWMQWQFERAGLWQNTSFPKDSGQRPTSYKALDKYTVEIKVPAISQGIMLLQMGANAYTSPPEIWTQAGGWGSDWKKVIGNGPFIIDDYVSGTSIRYVRNPNYFDTSPIHPQDRLPYVDSVTQLIVPDMSTRQAAFRTGKIDFLPSLVSADARAILKQGITVNQNKRPDYFVKIPALRLDKAPFSDLRVRQALNLAVNQQEILDQYYGGDGVLHGVPFPPGVAHAPYYTPFDQLPDNVKMLYSYDPVKARQLLTDAGYPNGFKTSVVTANLEADIDLLSLIKAYWLKVGVDLTIEPKENAVYQSMNLNKTWDAMMYASAVFTAPDQPVTVTPGHASNLAFINDPYYNAVLTSVGRDVIKDPKTFQKIVKDTAVYQLASAWGVWMPRAQVYDLSWPWVKDYNGVYWFGWAGMTDWYKYLWIDQPLKKSMGF
jgi:peptide/nickel transport system substrate-binding protein